MLYERPKLKILEQETVDVICASAGDTYDGTENSTPVSGSWVQPAN